MQKVNVYKLPSTGEARELLREKGQFWTPDWVAEAMVEYVFSDKGGKLFDPAAGAGAVVPGSEGKVKYKFTN